ALDGQANLVKEKDALSALTEEATALLASKPNHPSGDALQALVEKNKELLDSSELTPEALATAKTGLETLIALLKEDKPAVFVDPATGVEVQFSNLEPTAIKGLKVAKVEANQAEKEELKGREATIFDIEGVDASGQDVDTQHPSLVKIPVDKDKEVEQVLFFPEGQAPQSLAFERVGDVVIFTAPHFTHYAIVYKPAKTEGPDQPIQPEEPAKPDQPVQPAQPNQPVQPSTPVTPDPANPLKPTNSSQVDQ
ncbi:endo-beta-N-acetylglucosaminidase, partial [Streptococcus sp. IMAU11618]